MTSDTDRAKRQDETLLRARRCVGCARRFGGICRRGARAIATGGRRTSAAYFLSFIRARARGREGCVGLGMAHAMRALARAEVTTSMGRVRGTSPAVRAMRARARANASATTAVEALEVVGDVEVIRVSDGVATCVKDGVIPNRGRALACFLTQFGDFDSWELAQTLVDDMERLKGEGVTVVAIGIGSVEAARSFAKRTRFPIENLYADPEAKTHAALGFAPGLGRKGGAFEWIEDKAPFVNGYAKLLLMCAGIGSPGTLPAVFGGYFGSKDKDQIFVEGSNLDVPAIRKAMKLTLGEGYLRPFELATLRLNNMVEILNNWEELTPKDSNLLIQRGGAIVFDDGIQAFRHDDQGILGYCPAARLVDKALSEDPAAPPDAVETLHLAAATRKAYVDDIYTSISALEKAKEKNVAGEDLTGKWRLIYTTGTKKVAANVNKTGGGSYFPIPAVQSFDLNSGRIRNGIYLGPIKFFFDGPFIWREKLNMLEFTFTRVSLALGSAGPWSKDIDDGKWDAVKMAEQSASSGQGNVEKGKASKPGANPFFKFVYADDKCIAARGRGGGLALWARVGKPETDAQE